MCSRGPFLSLASGEMQDVGLLIFGIPSTHISFTFGPQEQIEMKTWMRNELCKLLAMSTSQDQAMRTAKALALCNGCLQALCMDLQQWTEVVVGL